MPAPRVRKIGEEISENVDEVGRRGVGEEAGQWNGRTLVPGALLPVRRDRMEGKEKKKMPIYKPLAENEV